MRWKLLPPYLVGNRGRPDVATVIFVAILLLVVAKGDFSAKDLG
jgi:hypothetical protein